MTKPVWSHVLTLSDWTFKKAHGSTDNRLPSNRIAGKPEPRLQNSSPTEISLSNHT